MGMNLRVRELILRGETEDKTFYDVISDGTAMDWQTFDQHILQLYEEGLVTEETAMAYCTRRTTISRGLDRIKAEKGEATTGITGLGMEQKKEEKRSGY